MASSFDPDQTPLNAVSDQGLHCLNKRVYPDTKGYYGNLKIGYGSSRCQER